MYDLPLLFAFNRGFKFQGCHDLTMLSVNINGFAIITVKNVDYCFVIHDLIKYEATY